MAITAKLDILELFKRLERKLTAIQPDDPTFYQRIADAPFEYELETALLFLGFLSFFLVDEAKQTIYLAASSNNEYYHRSVEGYNFNPKEYKIPLNDDENSIVQAIMGGKSVSTTNWDTLRRPRIEDGVARINQASSGIGYSEVVPFNGAIRGAILYNFFQEYRALGKQQETFMHGYTALVNELLTRR